MSSNFQHIYVTPQRDHTTCRGSGCYCFIGNNQFNDDMSTISSAASVPLHTTPGFSPMVEVHSRDRALSYESNNDNTLTECQLCLSLRNDEEVFYCTKCELGSCEACRNKMIENGGLDCFDGEQDEYLCPACYKESRQHLFFDENGAEISRDAFLQMQEDEGWGFLVPTVTRGTLRHPRVLLNFLRYIDSHNEVAKPDEQIFLKPIPPSVYENMLKHSSIQNPSIGFEADVNELLQRIEYHRDLSA